MIFHFGGDRMNRGRPVGGAASSWDRQQMGVPIPRAASRRRLAGSFSKEVTASRPSPHWLSAKDLGVAGEGCVRVYV